MEELERLARANPVSTDEVVELSRSARARATYQEITMQSTDPVPARTGRGRLAPLLVGVAIAAVLVGGVTVALTGGTEPESPPVAGPDDAGSEPISPDGGMAMCIEVYSLDTLPNREFAFDGTVTAIEGDGISFAVEEAFTGDVGSEITLQGATSLSAITLDNPAPVAVGDRLLVSGDGGFVWGCGFTQPYDTATADAWRSALAG